MSYSPAPRRLSRRGLLRGLGGAALALPLLPSLAPDVQAAPGDGTPKRFIFVFTSNGQKRQNWWPSWSPSWSDLGPNVREAPLQLDAEGGVTPILGAEFAPLMDQLLLLRGLDHYLHDGGGHEAHAPLAASPVVKNVTMDQILAYSDALYPETPPVRSLHMMIKQQFQSAGPSASVDAALQNVPHETDVLASYQRLFGDFVEDSPDPADEARRSMKLGVIDRLREEYDTLRSHPRLSSEDRARLEAHLEHIHDLHARLSADPGAACTKPEAPAPLSNDVDENLPQITRDNIDLLAAAIRCDRVRVATLMLCPGTDLRDFSFLGLPGGEHHGVSHSDSPGARDTLRSINNWYAKQLAYLLEQLDETEDPSTGETYLDNTIVYWGNEDGCNDYDAHKQFCLPALLAGGKNMGLRGGRYIDYREHGKAIRYGDNCNGGGGDEPTDDIGRPYNSLPISIMEAMGLSPEDWESSPGAGFGDYDDNYCNGYSQQDGKQGLPFLT